MWIGRRSFFTTEAIQIAGDRLFYCRFGHGTGEFWGLGDIDGTADSNRRAIHWSEGPALQCGEGSYDVAADAQSIAGAACADGVIVEWKRGVVDGPPQHCRWPQ